jgi:hypothetical protein
LRFKSHGDRVSPIRNLRTLRIAGAFALLQVILISIPNSSFAASAPTNGPTLSQLISYVDASSQLKSGPNVSTSLPTLTAATNDGTAAMIPSPCISSTASTKSLPSNAGTTCAFGDTTATRTIFLFGDSQASMWLPAFNVAGTLLRWKIVFVAKDGCGPWISPVTSSEGSSACNQWVHGEIALVNQLKPQVVVPVGLTLATLSNNQYPSTNQFVEEVQQMVQGIEPSHARILLLQEIPQFYSYFTSATPQSCLTVHSSSIQNCELTVKQIKKIETTVGLNAVAVIDHLEIVPSRELFCSSVRCDVFVNSPHETHLVYQDWAHMNATYSTWIGRATAQLLAKYLPS